MNLPPMSMATGLPPLFPLQAHPPLPLSGDWTKMYQYRHNPAISIELENADLWRQFHRHTTEMIVNKLGRRMFPTLRFNIRGLEEKATYAIYLDLEPLDDNRYKYSSGRWAVNGRADPLPSGKFGSSRWYLHPDGPAPGALWMRQPVSFHRLKLTNNVGDPNGNLLLNSMHKYQPKIYVLRLGPYLTPEHCVIEAAAAFPETQFITVTAYQNEEVTKLKVENNPFAKGFRDNGLHAEKRRFDEDDFHQQPPDDISPGPKKVKQETSQEPGPHPPAATPESSSRSSGGPSPSSTSSPHSFSALALASPAEPPKPRLVSPLSEAPKAPLLSSPPSIPPPFPLSLLQARYPNPFLASAFSPVSGVQAPSPDANAFALALYLRSLSSLYQSVYNHPPTPPAH